MRVDEGTTLGSEDDNLRQPLRVLEFYSGVGGMVSFLHELCFLIRSATFLLLAAVACYSSCSAALSNSRLLCWKTLVQALVQFESRDMEIGTTYKQKQTEPVEALNHISSKRERLWKGDQIVFSFCPDLTDPRLTSSKLVHFLNGEYQEGRLSATSFF